MKPTPTDVDRVLAQLEPLTPCQLARQAVARFRSNAQRLHLPVTNVYDSGAPSLRVDETLAKADGGYLVGKR